MAVTASPLCGSVHRVERTGFRRACRLCPPLCPDCRGQGFRIVTQDGTRPACITCDGLGWLLPGRGTHDQQAAEAAHG